MSRADTIELYGIVKKCFGYGQFIIDCAGFEIQGKRGNQLSRRRITPRVGDRVKVRVSPYDTSKGIIIYKEL